MINQQPDLIVCGEAGELLSALEAIAAVKPDVAIVDLMLPTGSGVDLIKSVRKCSPDTAIVVLTMHDESNYGERALRAGARGFVTKGDATKKVLPALRRVLEGRLYVSEDFAASMATRFIKGSLHPGRSHIEQLSNRELEVYRLLGRGRETRDIAESLQISPKTVQVYYGRIKEKLGYDHHMAMVREAVRWLEAEERGMT